MKKLIVLLVGLILSVGGCVTPANVTEKGMVSHTSNASDLGIKAQESNLVDILQVIRVQIELYKMHHNGNPPLSSSEAAFVACMTGYTDVNGVTQATAGSGVYGPYIRSIPVNPFTNSNTITISSSDSTGSATGGWHFNITTGQFQADDDGTTHDDVPHTKL